MIKIKNVSKYYKNNDVVTLALQNINLEFNQGEFVAICGESGSGKSTLLNIIGGLDSYDEGEIYFRGNETSFFNVDDMDSFRKKYVAFVFQDYNIIDSYTVLQNVMLPLLVAGKNKKEAKIIATNLIEKIGIKNVINNRGSKLSGGEKQRVAIARALALDTPILACDEPTGNLDSITSNEIINLLKEVAKDKLVLVVSHNFEEIKDVCTRKIVLSDGKVITDEIYQNIKEDSNTKLELDYVPLNKNVISTLTKFNIFSTPKKSIFFALVFFLLSIVVLSCYQYSSYTINNSNIRMKLNSYGIYDENFIIANNNGKPFENFEVFENLDADIKYNPFSEYEGFSINYFNDKMSANIIDYSMTYDAFYGKLPTSKEEAVLVFPFSRHTDENIKMHKFGKIEIRTNDSRLSLNVTGIAYKKNINDNFLVVDKEWNEKLNSGVVLNNLSVSADNIDVIYEKVDRERPLAIIPYGYTLEEINLTFKLDFTYEIKIDYDIEYYNGNEVIFEMPLDYNQDIDIFEVRIYANDAKKVINILEENNINYIYPATIGEIKIGNAIDLALELLIAILVVIAFYILSTFVLRGIYSSKKKDYLIMRIIGISKKDMRKICFCETMVIGLVVSVITYILSIILGFIPYRLFAIYHNINILGILTYLLLMIVFNFSIGRIFTKKLFKNSSLRILKED